MTYRLIAATVLVAFLNSSAFSAIYPNKAGDEALTAAASRLKAKEYLAARQAASKSVGDKGPKAFLMGYCSIKLEQWEDAADQMAVAAENYPILADYALYYRGVALSKLQRDDDALAALMKLMREYRDSRMVRSAWSLYADTLLAAGFLKEALTSYTSFIERYPAGNDSLQAMFNSALAKEKLGDAADGAKTLRGIWLNYPASPVAEKAAQELKRMAASGVAPIPYKSNELIKRGNTLFDLGRYARAAETLAEVPLQGLSEEAACKVRLKRGQALYKAKKYAEAEEVLKGVGKSSQNGCTAEANLWLGRTLDGAGKSEEAYALFIRLSESSPSVADDALLKAAYLKRFQRRWKEALPLFKRYLAAHADSKRIGTVQWEAAWASYQSRNYQEAAQLLRRVAEREENREKALYWLGKALIASGDQAGGEAQFAQLCAEYPTGYYALLCNKGSLTAELQRPPANVIDTLPVPAGFEREKALIGLGMYDEAAKELAARKSKNYLGMARLYLEMENFNGAFHAISNIPRKRGEKDNGSLLGIKYPLAYREHVTKNAALNGIPESLVYAIMYAESYFSPTALSQVGAVGLMQIMPATAERISQGDSVRLTRPELNIRLGTKHLKDLLKNNDGNVILTAACYNAGSKNVKRWQKSMGDLPEDEFVESIPFGETREYVKKVLMVMALYQKLYRLPAPEKRVAQ